MKAINPYLTFNGNCREAMNFYKECLGGELELMTFKDSPMQAPEEAKNNIMHATLKNNDTAVLMASDGMPGQKVTNGSSVWISVNCSSLDEITGYFNNLSKGGKVIMSLQDTFWGAKFGMLIDKFGIQWMFNLDMKQAK